MVLNVLGKEVRLGKEMMILLIPFLLVLLGFIGLLISRGDGAVVFKQETESTEQRPKPIENKSREVYGTPQPVKPEEDIKVYVTGCVQNPGIVTMKKGQVIDDAIKLAGGATEDADLGNINLVYKLRENVTLKILPKPDSQTYPISPSSTGASSPKLELVADAGKGIVMDNGSGNLQKSEKKIDLNTASAAQLESLPDVGAKTAQDIIAYRNKQGGFKTIQDIMSIPGIKESRFNKIKELITVD